MDLTDDEQKLLKCVEIGFPFFGINATIRGSVIRSIAIGDLVEKPNPNGINIAGAKIKDALILLNVSTDLMLHFKSCSFEKTLLATGASVPILRFEHCQFRAPMGPAIGAEGLKVSGGFTMHDCAVEVREANAAIEIDNCEIGGHLSFQRTVVLNPKGQCISGDRAKIGSNLTLAGIHAKSGQGELGAIRFSIAEIGGKINLTESTSIESVGGPAAVFDATSIGDSFYAIGLNASASDADQGTLRVNAMDIGGQFVLHKCGIANESSVAVQADRLRVHGSVMVGPETWIYGSGALGALRLMGAKVDGNVTFENTAIFNGTGPVIAAETLVVDGHLHLNGGLRVEGAGDDGVIRLGGARVGRRLQADAQATAVPTGGLVLDLGDATAGRLQLNPRFVDDDSRWLNIDRLSYTGLPVGASRGEWIDLIRDSTTDYSPQAWRQLADAYRNAGHDNDARRVLFAQQRDRADRTLRPAGREGESKFRLWMQRRWLAVLRVTIGYGYQVGRALAWLAVIALFSVGLGFAAGNMTYHGEPTAARQEVLGAPPSACSAVEQAGMGLGIGLPLIKQATSENCHVNTTTRLGQLVTVVGWLLQVLAWVFATLFIAGFTKIIRVN